MDPAAAAAAAEAAELEALYNALRQIHIVNYALAAALTASIYDILSNFEHEFVHIWKSPWSLAKALYLLARYYTPLHLTVMLGLQPIVNPTYAECQVWLWLLSMGGLVVVTTTVDAILVLRLWAIYDKKRKVLICLIVMMSCQFLIELAVSLWATLAARPIPTPPVPWPGCSRTSLKSATLTSWIPNTLVAFTCVVMMLYKVFNNADFSWKDRRTTGISPLFSTFIWDGTFFFIMLFLVNFTTALLTIKADGPFAELLNPWLNLTYSLAGTKMILNLRITANSPRSVRSQGDTTMTVTQDHPHFAPNRNIAGEHSYEMDDMSPRSSFP